MDKENKKFLDTLESVFEENQDSLEEAIKIIKKKPNPDGMLFSKEFQDHMAIFGDKEPLEALKDVNFWRHLAKYSGMSDEEFEKIIKR